MPGLPSNIGRYEVQQRLGQGGMGAIYLARDPAINRLVAVKLLNADIATDDLRRRFAQEARASGALSHPHIVTIHDFGEIDGAPFIVMEYVRGETLAAAIKRRAPITVVQKLRWIEQVCSALGYAHQKRVIHRDVKPSNLMVDQDGLIRVVDFGIARIVGGNLTKMSTVIGTPGYMSPEQLQGGTIDSRSDIFAVGAVLYELLSYHEAFPGDTPHSIMHRVVSADPPPLHELLSGPDLSITKVVETALQKVPDYRYADMAQFETAVARARQALEESGQEPAIRDGTRAASDLSRSRRRRTDPIEIARRRAEQIELHLAEARQAHAAGDAEAAIEACEAVLLMDPSSVPALDLLEVVRQDLSGSSPAAAAIAAAARQAVMRETVPREPPPTAQTLRAVALPDIELLPRSTGQFADATDQTVALPVRQPARLWPWAAAAVVGLLATTVWAVSAGLIDLGLADLLGIGPRDYVELAMPTLPVGAPEAAPATTPPRPAPPPRPAADIPVNAARTPAPPQSAGAPPGPPSTPPAASESIERDAATTAPDSPVTRARRDVGRLLLRAEAAENSGNTNEALMLYREVLQLEPKNGIAARGVTRIRVDYLLRRAESQILAGDYEGALNDLNTATADDPNNPRAAELREAIAQGKKAPPRKPPQ